MAGDRFPSFLSVDEKSIGKGATRQVRNPPTQKYIPPKRRVVNYGKNDNKVMKKKRDTSRKNVKSLKGVRKKLQEDSSPSESSLPIQKELVPPEPELFVPKPVTPETLKVFRKRIADLLNGFETAEEKVTGLNLAIKALDRSIVGLSTAVSKSDPVMRKLGVLNKQKTRLMSKVSLISSYLEKQKSELSSLF